MQGNPTPAEIKALLESPPPVFDEDEHQRWYASLPSLTTTKPSLSFWREIDNLQRQQP